MKKTFLLLYLIICNYKCGEIKYNHSNIENNLYFVLSTFRHGARQTYFKNDIFNNHIPDPGQLTTYGALQHSIIGQNNRKRYFNFLKLNNTTFDKQQIYIKSSNILRTVISTIKQIEGLFNSSINNKYIHYISHKGLSRTFNLYILNKSDRLKLLKYFNSCRKRKLEGSYYTEAFKSKYIPLFQKCYGKLRIYNLWYFCDNTISSFFEYSYNKKNNNIGKCGFEVAKALYDFCINYYDSKRSWNERDAYIFYIFFNSLFKLMKNEINGVSKLKMIFLGGHDSTVSPLMNFLNGLKIIKRTQYPHYAFNILFELRKYNNDFYLEIYYNDILKYNQTIIKFKNILDKSKYSNLYNYCGAPSWEKKTNSYNKSKLHNKAYLYNKTIIYNKSNYSNQTNISNKLLNIKQNLYLNDVKNDIVNFNKKELFKIVFIKIIYILIFIFFYLKIHSLCKNKIFKKIKDKSNPDISQNIILK